MSKERHCPECGTVISDDLYTADAMRAAFFAGLHDTWASLPDAMRQRFPSSEVLRKQALIAIGHCDVMTVAVGSHKAALDVAHAFQSLDRYCICVVQGSIVQHMKARSMARRALPKKQFRDVAEAVHAWIAEQTGIDARKAVTFHDTRNSEAA